MSTHVHVARPCKPGDPKVCVCGLRRDPVTHAWMSRSEHAQLAAERQQRRARFGATRLEGEALARAMNGVGL